MNKKCQKSNSALQRGVTLVEILIVVSVLAVLASFAIPSFGKATAQAELKAALENVQYSVDTARNIARMNGASVSLDIDRVDQSGTFQLVFSSPNPNKSNVLKDLQAYRLPEDIRLESEFSSYVFDDRGLIAKPGTITIVSTAYDSLRSSVKVR
jgi:prepilin-type N-terminal cleavage/methylation domain-containing protein